MNVELLDVRDDRVAQIWRALERTNTSFFRSWDWLEHWISSLPRSHLPVAAVFRDRGEPVAAGMFGRRRVVRHHWLPSRAWSLHATGDPRFDELCVEHNGLVGEPLALAALVDALPEGWDELVLPATDLDAFRELAVTGARVHVEREVACPYVDLERVRVTRGGYLALLGAKTRANIRRSQRALGALTVEIAADVQQAVDIYDELVALHQRAWIARGQPGAFADAWFAQFHRDLIVSRPDVVELVRVRAGSSTIGCLYNLRYRGRVLVYQTGTATLDDRELSPGLVCHVAAISDAAARGDVVYDFLGGDAAYKQRLSTGATTLRWIRVQRLLARFAVEERLRGWKHALAAR